MAKRWVVLVFILLILPYLFTFFHSQNFFVSHDGRYHLERIFYFTDAVTRGEFPPTWIRYYNSGFGSPFFIFLFPIPYIVGSLFYVLTNNLIISYKLATIFWLAIAGIGMFLFLRKGMRLRTSAGLIAAALYLYAPYTISQVFVRGSFRELAGSAIFPWVLFSLNLNPPLAILGLSIFLLTDGISVELFSPVLAVYLVHLLFNRSRKFLVTLIFVFGITGLISSYIWLPYLFESHYLEFDRAQNFREHFVYFHQFFNLHWGFGFSFPGDKDSIPLQLGVANIAVILLAGIYFLKKGVKKSYLPFSFFCLALFSIFLMLDSFPTMILWNLVKPLQKTELPWRFLSVFVFLGAITGGWLYDKVGLNRKIFWLCIIIIICLSSRYIRPNQEVIYDLANLKSNSVDATAFHEFIPITRSSTSDFESLSPRVPIIENHQACKFSDLKESNLLVSLKINCVKDASVIMPTLYFPGWQAKVDGTAMPTYAVKDWNKKELPVDLSGLVETKIPGGSHNLVFEFVDTLPRRVGKLLTLIGIIIEGFLALWYLFLRKPIFKKS